jgi:hypothetical protein
MMRNAAEEACAIESAYRPHGATQENVAHDYYELLRTGCTPECVAGFCAVVTDMAHLMATGCSRAVEDYEAMDRKGKLDPDAPGTMKDGDPE